MRGTMVAALILVGMLAIAPPADAKWRYVMCGHIKANGLRNEVTSGGNSCPVSCSTARRVLKKYLRTTHRNVGQWRCNDGGGNGAVLGQCRKPDRFVAVYDARWGE